MGVLVLSGGAIAVGAVATAARDLHRRLNGRARIRRRLAALRASAVFLPLHRGLLGSGENEIRGGELRRCDAANQQVVVAVDWDQHPAVCRLEARR